MALVSFVFDSMRCSIILPLVFTTAKHVYSVMNNTKDPIFDKDALAVAYAPAGYINQLAIG